MSCWRSASVVSPGAIAHYMHALGVGEACHRRDDGGRAAGEDLGDVSPMLHPVPLVTEILVVGEG